MWELKDLLALPTFLAFLCPGLVFVHVRTVITTGQAPDITKDNLAAFVAVSAIYTVAAATFGALPEPLWSRNNDLIVASLNERLQVCLFAFVVPAIVGALYAAAEQRDLTHWLADRVGLRPLYPAPSAWETMARRLRPGEFAIATLKDGTELCGFLDERACFSSAPGCTDLVLSEVVPTKDQPIDVTRSVWIASDELQTLEILASRANMQTKEALFIRRIPAGGNKNVRQRSRLTDRPSSS